MRARERESLGTETGNNKPGVQKSRLKKDRREAAREKRAESGGGRGGGRVSGSQRKFMRSERGRGYKT